MRGGKVGMEVPLVVLVARMTRWAVGGRQSNPLVSFSASRWAATTGQRAPAVCNLVATLVRTPVRPMWSCGAGLGGVGRLMSIQQRNQTRVLVRTKGEWGRDESWRLDCDGLEEVQDVFAIVCNGGQRLDGGLLCLNFLRRLFVICLHTTFYVFAVVVFPAGGLPFLCSLYYGASKNLQEIARVQLPMEDCGLREEWR